MVFSSLGPHEKDAFFDLLDEYFSTRQNLLKSLGSSDGGSANGSKLDGQAAASAVHKALAANPQATANLISAGLQHGSQNNNVKNSPFANAAKNPEIANSVGRVAAASLAFGQRNNPPPPPAPRNVAPPTPIRSTPPPPPAARAMPPALPRRTSSTSVTQAEEEQEEDERPAPPSRTPSNASRASGTDGLVSGRSFGDVKTNSFKEGFLSVKNGTKNKSKAPPSVAPPIPSAFPKRQNNFAPPPMRRVSTNESVPTRSPEPEPEPEDDNEWAEALYEYNSGEAGDLVMQQNQRVKIVSRDSEDWWTGEVNGKSGLFPASYVRVV